MATIEHMTKSEAQEHKKERKGRALTEFSQALRERLRTLGPDDALRLTLDPGETLTSLRQKVTSNAKQVGVAIAISTMRDERGLIVELAGAKAKEASAGAPQRRGRSAKPVVADVSETTGLESI